NGVLRVRDACRPDETRMTAADLGLVDTAMQDEVARLRALLASLTLEDGGRTLRFSGVNVQVVSGAGTTNAAPNGGGNLIVGYNEGDDPSEPAPPHVKTGSHNIVVGRSNGFSSYGGLVVGQDNDIGGPYASVTAGRFNIANGAYASVSGGRCNLASGE